MSWINQSKTLYSIVIYISYSIVFDNDALLKIININKIVGLLKVKLYILITLAANDSVSNKLVFIERENLEI